MTLETGMILGSSALLAMAIIAQALKLSGASGQRRWHRLILLARVGAAAALAAALSLAAIDEGMWTPFDLQQLTLSLAVAALILHLILVWGCRTDGAGPVIDMAVLALSLVAVVVSAREAMPTCPQRSFLFQIQWGFFVVGAGGAIVAGSTGLMLLLRGFCLKIGWLRKMPPRDDAQAYLRQATVVTLAALGSGLVTDCWLAWGNVGGPSSADPRSTCMAIAWLMGAMSLLAWRLRPGRQAVWASVLAISAASTAIFGLLAVTGIGRVLGM